MGLALGSGGRVRGEVQGFGFRVSGFGFRFRVGVLGEPPEIRLSPGLPPLLLFR